MNAEMCAADAGRPDARELSRVLAVRFERFVCGQSLDGPELEFHPTGSVSRTPATPEELAPGDVEGLAEAAHAWAAIAEEVLGDANSLAEEAAGAHARLALHLEDLQRRAVAVFQDAAAHGIEGSTLGSQLRVSRLVSAEPESAGVVVGPLKGLISVRLDWVEATSEFVAELDGARAIVGIADW